MEWDSNCSSMNKSLSWLSQCLDGCHSGTKVAAAVKRLQNVHYCTAILRSTYPSYCCTVQSVVFYQALCEHVLQITDNVWQVIHSEKCPSTLFSWVSMISSRPGLPKPFHGATHQRISAYFGEKKKFIVAIPLSTLSPAAIHLWVPTRWSERFCFSLWLERVVLMSSGRFRAPGRSMAADCLGQRLCDQMKISSLRHAHHVGVLFPAVPARNGRPKYPIMACKLSTIKWN